MPSSLTGGKRRRRSITKKTSKKLSKKTSKKRSVKRGGKRGSVKKIKTGLKRTANPVFTAYGELRKMIAKDLDVKMGKKIFKLLKVYTDMAKQKYPNATSMDIVDHAKKLFRENIKDAKKKYESME